MPEELRFSLLRPRFSLALKNIINRPYDNLDSIVFAWKSNGSSDLAARKEQPVTSMLGSLLKQVVDEMEGISEEISHAFQQQKKAIGGRGSQLLDIVKMLQTITS